MAFMLHGKQIQLIIQTNIQIRRIDFQRIIHEHIIIFAVIAFILSNIELVTVFTEVKTADDAV